MLWYEGFALPQTVFSCLYLHDDLKYLTVTKDTPKTSIFLLFTKALFRRVDEVSDLIFKTECRTVCIHTDNTDHHRKKSLSITRLD
jgi:hypothetical protein